MVGSNYTIDVPEPMGSRVIVSRDINGTCAAWSADSWTFDLGAGAGMTIKIGYY